VFGSRWLLMILLTALLQSCGEVNTDAVTTIPAETGRSRWYTSEQLISGAQVFANHCAICHGEQAQGLTANWRQRLADGSFPPPPLNGTAHAWHHPLSVLLQTIDAGGVALGGSMPAFGELLSDAEKRAAVAYFQQFWSDDIYQNWLEMGGVN
jgi:mono/diheme cytochrome c family protein